MQRRLGLKFKSNLFLLYILFSIFIVLYGKKCYNFMKEERMLEENVEKLKLNKEITNFLRKEGVI